ncbi:MAG: outer membrane beta-barrel protein [Flavobacteriaceae bacterium]|jgi:hypothetical protein|nr:outer membrane beta-barrel protein [Flavobacteriaceae bacterium]MBT3753548.1 outer membrane beta-barrel protein [Flavobacteriaceae bacterium]MBT4063300.1 outer membrane beta-barrel protein [Flavobacteriaceae bacterium]MBT4245733.1 outer membrane beta-barrel protein [Flavobacteriaceae bacterium]MBT4416228.1 outer membrane beta-barrel protein [Flavobacteriaceae bacterium]
MLKYFISILLIISSLKAISQEGKSLDTIPIKTTYGIKFGIDLSKQIRMLTEPDYKGLVFTGDYRILDRLFLAAEFGSEEKKTSNEVLDFDTDGTFLKLGVNYNIYNNQKGLNNEIYVGFRYGLGKFSHKLNSYTIYNLDQYWNQNFVNNSSSFTDLNASWLEFVLGFKAEIINNIFMGLDLRLNRLISQDKPTNFSNLYIPGFNKVLEENNFGVGVSYSVYYQIPIFKKDKK